MRAVPALALALAAWAFAPGVPALPAAHAEEPERNPARAAADALERARTLFAQQRNDAALAAIDEGLRAAPRDAQLRFQRGVVLADSGRTDEAIETFTALTQAFPELPEPHNHLAALHAKRGDLDLARASLENALRAFPSYGLARENLGDVQLRLAERAYERAIESDANNSAAREKLGLTRELLARISPPAGIPAQAAPVVPAPSETPARPDAPAVSGGSPTPGAPVLPGAR
jgi:tetratricopeptide (TPR) repeat protein